MLIRRKLILDEPEDAALRKVAFTELRNPDDQARFIIRQELARRGLLSPLSPADQREEMRHEQRVPAGA